MPTIELFKPSNDANISRSVRAPGGYESVYFTASSADGRTQVMAGLHYGHPVDGNYARLYLLYRAFPTRVPPPQPMQHASVTLTVAQGGRVRREFQRLHPHGPDLVREENGATRLIFAGVDLLFRRSSDMICEPIDDGPHHVIVTAPLCEVSGTVGSAPFAGYGWRDHRWGTRWPRETGGCASAALFRRDGATFTYIFGNRKHIRRVGIHLPHEVSLEPMLAEVIKPSIFASLLRRDHDG
jgi:hypothetical protein